MKKHMCVASILIFLFVAGIAPTHIFAVETTVVAGGDVAPQFQQEPVDATTQVVQKIEYALPFPGILPDHPLYFLKRIRDTILEKLINDPIRKAEFYILQSDKRLQMGIMLMESGKGTLGETTISKAEKYMEQAVIGLSAYKKSGGAVPPYVIERLEKATAKHQEVIADLSQKASEAEKKGLQGSMELVRSVTALIDSLR